MLAPALQRVLPSRAATVALLVLVGCVASPRSAGLPGEIRHHGYRIRARLDGWTVFQDRASAPALLRPGFANKHGPDDPPLFVALAEADPNTSLMGLSQYTDVGTGEYVELVLRALGERFVLEASAQLPDSDDIVFAGRLASGVVNAGYLELVSVRNGVAHRIALTRALAVPKLEQLTTALAQIELRGDKGWERPWATLSPAWLEEALGDRASRAHLIDPFEPVECPAGAHPLLWRAQMPGGDLHLFGSIHAGHASFYPFAPAIERAFEDAERLAVELDIRSPDVLRTFAQPAARRGSRTSLAGRLPPETYSRLEEAVAELGLDVEMFDPMEPWAVAITLGTLPWLAHGFDIAQGVDLYFLQRSGAKEIVQLESAAGQLEALSSLGTDFFDATLESLEYAEQDIEAIHRAWRCGDEDALEEVLLIAPVVRTPEGPNVMRALIDDRNHEMAESIAELAAEPGDLFVVVGAAHLIGEAGIPALLQAQGYSVERAP